MRDVLLSVAAIGDMEGAVVVCAPVAGAPVTGAPVAGAPVAGAPVTTGASVGLSEKVGAGVWATAGCDSKHNTAMEKRVVTENFMVAARVVCFFGVRK